MAADRGPSKDTKSLHIANEISHIHNAMLRGLNSIYLQAPHVRRERDIADLLFLTQSWSTWLLDHHHLKENTMLPGFETALGVPAGTLTLPSSSTASQITDGGTTMRTVKGKERERCIKEDGGEEGGEEDTISFLLHRVYAYASATHKDPQAYNGTTLQSLLSALAEVLAPHLTRQVGLLVSMREMCFGSSPAGGKTNINTKHEEVERDEEVPGPLPIPLVKITKTISSSPSTSPPISPSSSTFSTPSAPTPSSPTSSPAHSPPNVSLSLFPSTATITSRPVTRHGKTSSNSSGSITNLNSSSSTSKDNTSSSGNGKYTPGSSGSSVGGGGSGSPPASRSMSVIDKDAKTRLAQARALLEADDRANKLTQIHAAADAQAAAGMDPFVILPMIVRLRDSTTITNTTSTISPPFSPSSSSSVSRVPSSSSLASSNDSGKGVNMGMGMGMGMGGINAGGVGTGAGNKGEWPRMSVPAIHAVADKLSPRHAGAWRFLPCDVWGRPRELPFLGM
ncbi:hypothetical protein F5Y01DRAFT_326544 [Xylaria sp. FL0043]|nr:hypothetical protein F5Y01DRAFT_326544 [Xylaria sp. FL0043]